MMRRVLAAFVLAIAAIAGLEPAIAQTPSNKGTFVADVAQVMVPRIINFGTATSSAGCTVGIRGCLASTSFDAATSVSITGPDADLATPPYPARVTVDLFDSSANGTLACATQVISGINSAGFQVSESMGALTESGDTSLNAFRQVTSYVATGCSGGSTSDVIRLTLNENEIGVPVFMSTGDVLSVCATNAADTGQWYCARSGYTITGNGHSVAFGSATWEGSFNYVDGARVMLQVKGKRFSTFRGGGR